MKAASEKVKVMELSIVFNPEDYRSYVERRPKRRKTENDDELGPAGCKPIGYPSSGSSARRNIELIYQAAEASGVTGLGLEEAVRACFAGGRVRHVLLCSGFFVLHNKAGAPGPGATAAGSCETDGPLGVLALARAFACRGVSTSILCDAHNGPVIRAGYEVMLGYLSSLEPKVAAALQRHLRCLPLISDSHPPEGSEECAALHFHHAQLFPGAAVEPGSLAARAATVAMRLSRSLREAWGGSAAGEVDCLFALERLGAPYRNIRGRDIGEHTEPLDCLWPPLEAAAAGSGAAPPLCQESMRGFRDFCDRTKVPPESYVGLRKVAGIRPDALSLGIGDGGNEAGMGKVAHLAGVAGLSPGGEFVPLSVNGCYRSCDHLLLSTVSNWGGSAFEMAAHLLFPQPEADYVGAMLAKGRTLAHLESHVLRVIMSPPVTSVDGIDPSRTLSVDGMDFDPHHKGMYELLWSLGTSSDGAA